MAQTLQLLEVLEILGPPATTCREERGYVRRDCHHDGLQGHVQQKEEPKQSKQLRLQQLDWEEQQELVEGH